MKAKVVGIQNVDFTDDKGNLIQGVKLHYVATPTENQISHFRGDRVDTLFVRYGTTAYAVADSLKPNTSYDFIFDYDGRRAVLCDIKASA